MTSKTQASWSLSQFPLHLGLLVSRMSLPSPWEEIDVLLKYS
jgi:hypothetical protein